MNELEKTFSQEENSIPEITAEAAIVAETAAPVAEVESESVESDDENNQSLRRYFEMTKEELMSAMAEILEQEAANQHKDVNAIKQAFYAIRKAEIEAEAASFIESGDDQATFSSTPDPNEARFKEMLNEFKSKRLNYLEEEEKRRQENLTFKLRIIDELKTLVEDIDNINMHFP